MSNKKSTITPAALMALARGDVDNFLTASTPGGIEAQERAGQAMLVASCNFPIFFECHRGAAMAVVAENRKLLIELGFKFGKQVDKLFISCELPPGWKRQATDHAMWSDVLDEKGRKRISVFYKAAFYDLDAFARWSPRYRHGDRPRGGWGNVIEGDTPHYELYVTDHDGVDLMVEDFGKEPAYPKDAEESVRQAWLAYHERKDAAVKTVAVWMDANLPDWRDPVKSWDYVRPVAPAQVERNGG